MAVQISQHVELILSAMLGAININRYFPSSLRIPLQLAPFRRPIYKIKINIHTSIHTYAHRIRDVFHAPYRAMVGHPNLMPATFRMPTLLSQP